MTRHTVTPRGFIPLRDHGRFVTSEFYIFTGGVLIMCSEAKKITQTKNYEKTR